MKICPKCLQPVPQGRPACSNCGTEIDGVWPPPPTVQPQQKSLPKKPSTSNAWDLVWVFFGGLAGLALAYLLAAFIGPFGYLLLALGVPLVNKKMPPFVRGIGYMFLLALVITLVFAIASFL